MQLPETWQSACLKRHSYGFLWRDSTLLCTFSRKETSADDSVKLLGFLLPKAQQRRSCWKCLWEALQGAASAEETKVLYHSHLICLVYIIPYFIAIDLRYKLLLLFITHSYDSGSSEGCNQVLGCSGDFRDHCPPLFSRLKEVRVSLFTTAYAILKKQWSVHTYAGNSWPCIERWE